MATRARHAARQAAHSRRGPAVDQWVGGRRLYLDNLKVILIAAIIAGHGIAGYSQFDFWPYAEMNEVELSTATQLILYTVAAPSSLLLIPVLFLVAGLLTPRSVERKLPGPYVRDRLLRLGIPFALYVLLLQPLLMYPVHPPGEKPVSYWYEFVGAGDQTLDTGPLWFVGVLLVFSLTYAGWVAARRGRTAGRHQGDIRVTHLLVLAGAVAVATFLVRLLVHLGDSNRFITLNLWEWPACVAVFALGVSAAAQGWLDNVPERLLRQCRTATLAALGAFAVFVSLAMAFDVDQEQFWGGWRWPALVFAALDSTLAVFGPVWLLGTAQRHLDRRLRWTRPAVSRSAYGAFMLQGVVLIGLAMAMRPVLLPAEVKALIVAGGGIAGSFTLAWLLISRVPGVARVV